MARVKLLTDRLVEALPGDLDESAEVLRRALDLERTPRRAGRHTGSALG